MKYWLGMNNSIISTKKISSLIIIILFILLVFSSINIPINHNFDNYYLDNYDLENLELKFNNNPSPGTRQGGEIWEFSEEINYSMKFNKGSDYYIKISPSNYEGQRLNPKPEIVAENFLTKNALTAIDQVPMWLRENLTNKFTEVAQISFSLGEEAYAAFVDMDNDSDLDLVCGSPTNNLMYYENCGTSFEPIFVFDETIFATINSKIDLISADPAVGDIDADGDFDVICGNSNGDLIIIENSGDPKGPAFHSSGRMVDALTGYSSPCVGDLDGDSDLDILCGAEDGKIYIFENRGTPNNYIYFLASNPIEYIDVGSSSKPILNDLDGDGDLDLTIGEDQANINYYRNTGTTTNPRWLLDTTMYLGLTITTQTSPELADLNGDMRLDLIIGCGNGRFYLYENIGTGTEPQWQIWSSYQVLPGIEYYDRISYLNYNNNSYVDQFAELIIDAEPKYKDEIAFSIANTPTQVLRGMGSNRGLLKSNAELIYEIDQYLDYADIVDHGNYNTKDYYSTVKYKYKSSINGSTETTELPRDIYYWYIVHPKISDEVPAYINPTTGEPAAAPIGRFWREYLFYHNDSSYPSDPPTDPDGNGIPNYHYPKEESPPLLKEKLSGISYVYDSEPYNAPRGYDNLGYNNTRPWGYKNHAIESVSNWVAKTLPLNEQESADGERPIQPVRIAYHHNGNCGELGDLTVAAARTALIPAAAIMLWGEDHVWSEFYERGWHQWDNYWSDGGSVVDNFMNYWVGWNQRGGSGVSKWHGDDFVSDVTEHYVPAEDLSTLIVNVRDRDGNPVDGARVMLGSHWTSLEMSGYQVNIPFPSIWNYTDNYGICTFKVATQEGMADGNKNFSFKVISKLGNAEQLKVEIEHGQEHEFWFSLEGRKPESYLSYRTPYVDISEGLPSRFMVMLFYNETEAYQNPPNPMVGNYHKQPINLSEEIDFYLMNETNFKYYCQSNYKSGNAVSCVHVEPSGDNGYTGYILLDNSTWYLVGYNKNTIETNKKGNVKLLLYEVKDEFPYLEILEPENNKIFKVGDKINISGIATDDKGVKELRITIENEKIDITETLINGNWSYLWDTKGYNEGNYSILVSVFDTMGNGIGLYVRIILEPPPPPPPPDLAPPEITITSPKNGTEFTIGESISFKGTAKDNSTISTLNLILDSKQRNLLQSLNNTFWSYIWDTKNQDPGEFKYSIFSSDKQGNTIRVYGYVIFKEEIVDYDPPVITIDSPEYGQTFEQGEQVRFEGSIEDNIGVFSLSLIIDDNPPVGISFSSTEKSWSYSWTASSQGMGMHEFEFTAVDLSGNQNEEYIAIFILDITPPEVKISYPSKGSGFDYGAQIEIRGELYDNFGIDNIELIISGNGITEKIKKGISYDDDQWRYSWVVTDYYPAGQYDISVKATDLSGNMNSDTTSITINPKPEPKKDKGMFGLPGFESMILIAALAVVMHVYKIKKCKKNS